MSSERSKLTREEAKREREQEAAREPHRDDIQGRGNTGHSADPKTPSSEQKDDQEDSLRELILRNLVSGAIQTAIAAHDPTGVTGLHGDQLVDGTQMLPGPGTADLLERPAAGYLATASTHQSLALSNLDPGAIHEIARSADQAGMLNIDGRAINVLDFVPGGDGVQLLAGHTSFVDIAFIMAENGIPLTTSKNAHHGRNAQGLESVVIGGSAPEEAMEPSNNADRVGSQPSDYDVMQRDLEGLYFQHAIDINEAVGNSDETSVHTEIFAHGRVLELDTNFEARLASNQEEKVEAKEHLTDMRVSGKEDVSHDEPNLHFRTQMHAFIKSRNEGGMSID